VRIRYPASVDLPVDERTRSARARVENRTGVEGGLFDAVRNTSNAGGAGDLVSVGLVTAGIHPGEFVRVRFDCRDGSEAPKPTDCPGQPDIAGGHGAITAPCALALALR